MNFFHFAIVRFLKLPTTEHSSRQAQYGLFCHRSAKQGHRAQQLDMIGQKCFFVET